MRDRVPSGSGNTRSILSFRRASVPDFRLHWTNVGPAIRHRRVCSGFRLLGSRLISHFCRECLSTRASVRRSRSVIGMARALGVRSLAEAVRTESQLRQCMNWAAIRRTARYWFGDPVPATVFAENWLSTKSDVLLL